MDDVGESIEDSAKTPEELLMCREQLNQLLSRLQGILSKSEYDVLMLYGNGLSYKEIAERLSVTEKRLIMHSKEQEKRFVSDCKIAYVLKQYCGATPHRATN